MVSPDGAAEPSRLISSAPCSNADRREPLPRPAGPAGAYRAAANPYRASCLLRGAFFGSCPGRHSPCIHQISDKLAGLGRMLRVARPWGRTPEGVGMQDSLGAPENPGIVERLGGFADSAATDLG